MLVLVVICCINKSLMKDFFDKSACKEILHIDKQFDMYRKNIVRDKMSKEGVWVQHD